MRELLLALGALVGLAVVAVGGWWLVNESDLLSPGEPARAAPEDGLERFLSAWEDGDVPGIVESVWQPPDDLRPTYEEFFATLEPEALHTEPGQIVEVDDGRARAPVDVTVVGPDYGEVHWQVDVELLRDRGAWRVAWQYDDVHPQLRRDYTFDVVREELDRAAILAHDGTPLARSGELVTFGFEPGAVEDPDELAEAFEEAVPGSGEDVEDTYDRGGLVEGWFYPVVTVPADQADDIRSALSGVDGVLTRREQGRSVLEDGFAQHVVGRVGEASEEQLEELGPAYEEGDEVGQYGLERRFEEELSSAIRIQVVLREGQQGPVRELIADRTSLGDAGLRTTLDVDVQRAVERALEDVEGEAAIVVVAPDGAIRASASRPLSGYNRAFEGAYAPGSTFKVVTAEAVLAAGATPQDEVECPEDTIVGGLSLTNAGDVALGTTTLTDAFAISCNTTFGQLGAELGGEALAVAAERFGFGVEPQLPLPAVGGSFPLPEDTAEIAAAAIGQGRVETSPLHLASVAAAAHHGTWHPPYLLVDAGAADGQQVASGVLEDLRSLQRAVVAEGTGTAADVSDAPPVEGKTGTAQAGDGVEHAWFAGSWDDLGFAVLVEGGGSGADVAAPIAGRLVQELQALRED